MSLFDMITYYERGIIDEYIERRASLSEYDESLYPKADLKYILRFWEEAKSNYLSKIFNESLIIEKEFCWEKTEQNLSEEMYDAIYRNPFVINFRNFLLHYPIKELYDREIVNYLDTLLWNSNLIPNIYSGQTIDIPLPSGKVYTLQNGCKTSKALGKIAKEFNIEGFEDFRITHSQVLNDKIVKGNICLSIHPLDYMTMSDNDCGWKTCMSWVHKGDYRQGTVEMMNSPCVVVAYLKSATDYNIIENENEDECYVWNSKRWRELFIVDEHGIFGITQYPYGNSSLENEILDWLKELAETKCGFSYSNDLSTYCRGEIENNSTGERIFCHLHTHSMYNDCNFGRHSCYYAEPKNWIAGIDITYSGKSECMVCGKQTKDFFMNDENYRIACIDCDPVIICEECGEIIDLADAVFINGEYYCEHCSLCFMEHCHSCGALYLESDLNYIKLAYDDTHIFEVLQLAVCKNCICDPRIKYKTINSLSSSREVPYILIKDLTEVEKNCLKEDNLNLKLLEVLDYDNLEDAEANNPWLKDSYLFIP